MGNSLLYHGKAGVVNEIQKQKKLEGINERLFDKPANRSCTALFTYLAVFHFCCLNRIDIFDDEVRLF